MGSKRTIVTDYQKRQKLVKRCCSTHEGSAVMRAVAHLLSDRYGASCAVVYDSVRGRDIAVVTRPGRNKVEVFHKRKGKV